MSMMIVRPAELKDVRRICELLKIYSEQHIVLARDEADVTFYLKNFTVCEIDGVVEGCSALRDFGNELYEVRSLVVNPDKKGMGIGRRMIEFQFSKFKGTEKNVRIFALTYQIEFFRKMGFSEVEKELFPEKIWSDCVKCAKREHCDEIAVLYEIKPE
ncbi:MAG: GNAT family N-acetyltransferase [Lentisphaeria bacterium]|nr:GNAT family N-acetyltransferase [Lentisphaeria bacterium]